MPLNAGTAWRQRVHLARRGDDPWQRVPHGQTPVARFRFPTKGPHRCEVIAFDYGGRVPGTLTFTVKAEFDLPETLRRGGGSADDRIDVSSHPWYPPVQAVPTQEGRTLRLVWRREDETEWRPLEPGTGVSVAALGRSEQTVLFSAEEDGFWRDQSPLRLPVRVTLPLDAYLTALQQELTIYPTPDWVLRALHDCATDARARLDELAKLAARQKKIKEGLQRLGNR